MHNNAGVYLCVNPTAFEAGGIWSQDLNYFDIWKVDVDGLFVRKDEAGGMEDSYYVDEDIPPSRIELYRAATNHPSMQNSVVAHLSTTPSQSINVRI
jgi:hypothetical protein